MLKKFERKVSEIMASDVNRRRAARQKKARQRQLKFMLILFIIIAIIILAIMCFTVFFKVEKIKVSGSKLYTSKDIVSASNITTDDSWFFLSEDDIEDNIRKKLNFVDSVELKKEFPNKVQLIVTDAKEYACYKSGDKYFIISEKGYILKEQDEIPENVFAITTRGISGKPGEKAKYTNVAEEQIVSDLIKFLHENNININEIDASSTMQIKLKVEDRYTVLLGKNEYLEDKVKHLKGMILAITNDADIIDLSVWSPENRHGLTRKSNK